MGSKHLSASHVAIAVAYLCKTKYTGFVLSEYNYPRFEEERLRYLFSKVVKMTSYFTMRLSLNAKAGVVEEEFNVESCEHFAESRDAKILSADVVFLCALKELHSSYKPNLKIPMTDESIFILLDDTDQNIYDYVIDNIEDVCSELKKKSDEAKAIRDWKPAVKFAEPEKVLGLFFENIEKSSSENIVTLKLQKFFGSTDLKISIHKSNGIYYAHDNGCAVKHLSKRINDKQKLESILKKVCHSCWIYKGRITGRFCASFSFFEYLKRLVFVSHADLYYTKVLCQLCPKEKDYFYVDAENAEVFDEQELLDVLKNGIGCSYDENQGLYCWLDAKCSLSSARIFFLIETLENRYIRFSDRRKGDREGEVFEEFYWNNDDISPYGKFICKIADRFGADFDGKDVYLTEKHENFNKALYKFFNMAMLFTEFGHNIALPKTRKQADLK